jgi:hypothetical protein
LPFRLEEAVRSDEHAPAACTALAVTAVPAVLGGKHDSRIARITHAEDQMSKLTWLRRQYGTAISKV